MTKLTIDPAGADTDALPPPAAISERTTSSAIDARGRKIEVRKLKALDRMRMAMALGAEHSANLSVNVYATMAWSVTAIDGDPLRTPHSMREVEFLVGRLDEDGIAAAMAAWTAAGWMGGDADETAKLELDAAKNSPAREASA